MERIFPRYDTPLYFITFNTARRGEPRGIAVGRYVLVPDHVHLFVRGGIDFTLPQWTRMLKRALSRAISASLPHWQEGFFDHLMRSGESHAQKWDYVRMNPVRAGLVEEPDQWSCQGEITLPTYE